MKKTFILSLLSLLCLTLQAQEKIYINKGDKLHAYPTEQVRKLKFNGENTLVVTLQDGSIIQHDATVIDSVSFTVPQFYKQGPTSLNATFTSNLNPFTVKTVKGADWVYDSKYKVAKGTGYVNQTTTHESESYLVSPEFDLSNAESATVDFQYVLQYVRSGVVNRVLITDNYTGDPTTTKWQEMPGTISQTKDFYTWTNYSEEVPARFIGASKVVIAFEFACTTSSATWEIKNFKLNIKALETSEVNPGDDDPVVVPSDDAANVNKNPVDAERLREAWRLEYPHVRGGDMDLVVVHSTAEYGITYSLEWSCTLKANRWTCYEMYEGNMVSTVKRKDQFREDDEIPSQYRTTLSDYSGSGYSRGHLCPSSDRLANREANSQTFFLTNMQPQIQTHNGGVWNNLEKKVREIAGTCDTLYVVKAATIEDYGTTKAVMKYTSSGLIVPSYFYMALMAYSKSTNTYKAIGLWSPHAGGSTTEYITIKELEARTGIDFFCNLPDDIEDKIESEVDKSSWGF